jgi:hypothetical protein
MDPLIQNPKSKIQNLAVPDPELLRQLHPETDRAAGIVAGKDHGPTGHRGFDQLRLEVTFARKRVEEL